MKALERNSWDRKWHLEEGDTQLSLNPAIRNNLNDDLEVTESLKEENPLQEYSWI